ncbi:hypothetical protein QVD17_38727 [Tagetes erecta]|uniref:Uncharacterized protein n=1 Tax=Tagetes erecta TaxID=13708 RepID=A0AAD8NGG4_TARER|nr:hypothetical protein QVD17_38727 [Tagetes erecta]
MRAYLLLAIFLCHHLILTKGLTLQQLQGVEGVEIDSGNVVRVKHELKVGKGTYGGANMNRDPNASKSDSSSSQLPRIFCVSVGFFILLLFVY